MAAAYFSLNRYPLAAMRLLGDRKAMALSRHPFLRPLVTVALSFLVSACANVHVVRLTSETFPPRPVSEVQILDREPTTDHVRLAELMASSTSDVEQLQHEILKKAAKLGASAVVFSRPTMHTEQRSAYAGGYSPWGYYSPYYYGPGPHGYVGIGYGAWGGIPFGYGGMYGPWGPGWGYMDVPYVVQVHDLKGLAIRYTGTGS